MRLYLFYFSIALLAFVIGSAVFYAESTVDTDSVEVSSAVYERWVEKNVRQFEPENRGFDELLSFKDGDTVAVQGGLDAKFLCPDVTDWQPNICTTDLIGNSNENRFLRIRLPVCRERDKSNCILWKPNNLCSENKECSNMIRIYDNDSKPTDFVKTIQLEGAGKSYYYKNIDIKVTGKVSIIEGKYYLKSPVEKIEIINKE